MEESRPRRARRPPGEIVECIVWRLTERTAKGMRRQAVYNASADSDLVSILRACGVGRYRVEWCDCRRQIARVTTHVVELDGRVYRARPLRKSKPLKLPPPRYVAPGPPPHMVPYAPEARRLPPPGPPRRPRRPGTT